MDRMRSLLARFDRRAGARSWCGPRPEGRREAVLRAIAAQLGYPTEEPTGPFVESLAEVGRGKAAELLAFAASTSLAYGRYGPPREGFRRMAAEALQDMGPEAVFYTVSDPTAGSPVLAAMALSGATFEAGVMGYDAAHAFIYWVEEED